MLFRHFCLIGIFSVWITQVQAQHAKPLVHPEGRYIEVNHAKLWIETTGSGRPLYLLAGGPGSSHLYLHSFDSLSAYFQLVFIDQFGRGKSDTANKATEYSIRRDVEDLDGIRKALGHDSIAVLGHSYGAVVAQLYALRYKQHVSHLIIANGFYNGKMWQANDDNSNAIYAANSPEQWDELMALRAKGLKSSDPEHYHRYLNLRSGLLYMYNPDNAHKFPDDPAYPNDFNTRLYYQIVGQDGDFLVTGDMARFDVTKDLKNLRMPVLIFAGRYDRVSIPRYAIEYKRFCPQAKFVMFEKSGHSPQVEEPDAVMKEIIQFAGSE